jgi:hypothetical protein
MQKTQFSISLILSIFQMLKIITVTFCLVNFIATISNWAYFAGLLDKSNNIGFDDDNDFLVKWYGLPSLKSMGVTNPSVKRIILSLISCFILYTNISTQLAELIVNLICLCVLLLSLEFWDVIEAKNSNNLEEVEKCITFFL